MALDTTSAGSPATAPTFAEFLDTDVTFKHRRRKLTVAVRDLLAGVGETEYFIDAMERVVDDALIDDDPAWLLEIVEWTLLDVVEGVKRARIEFELFKAQRPIADASLAEGRCEVAQ